MVENFTGDEPWPRRQPIMYNTPSDKLKGLTWLFPAGLFFKNFRPKVLSTCKLMKVNGTVISMEIQTYNFESASFIIITWLKLDLKRLHVTHLLFE